MMKSIIMLGISWLMICNFSFVSAQNFEETIAFADKQMQVNNYQLAVKEYQRALLFAKGRRVAYLYKQIANAFFANNQLDQASYFYDISYNASNNDSIKNELIFNKTQCLILQSKFDLAVVELLNVDTASSEYFQKKKNFYLAISQFGLENFAQSEIYFLSLLNVNDIDNRNTITQLFSKKKNLHRPNPKTAKTLSRIIPGMGQFYAGDIKNGLNSLILTSCFVGLGVYMADRYTYFDAILTALPWFMRYYKGGFGKAYEIAEHKRAKRRSKTYLEILKVIEKSKE